MVAQWLQNPHLDGASFELAGGPTGVLLSHGFTATTTEMRLLAEFLHAHGCTVAAPLLPGHGTSPHEMNRCRWTDWLAALTRAYQALRARCSRVFVGGESMGGALALYLATQQPEVAGVLTYAPALGVASSRREQLLVRWGSWWIPFRRKGPYAPTHTDAYWQGYTVYPLRAVIQLLRFQAALRTRLPLVRQPLLIVQGRLDDTIALDAVERFYRAASVEPKAFYWLEHSTHCVVLDQEWELAADITWDFIQRVCARE